MVDEILQVRLNGGIAQVLLNRPSTRNALSDELFERLHETFTALDRDDGVHVIVLTGAGTAFCAGGDVTAMPADSTELSFDQRVANLKRRARAIVALQECQKLTVARINGTVVGAGLALAMACDFRIAATSAVFITGFIRMALSGDCGAIYLLQRALGEARAKELALLSEPLSAPDALAWGAVTRCVEDAQLDAETERFATRLASGPRTAQSYMKLNFRNDRLSLAEAIEVEAERLVRSALAPEHAEAKRAFLEKRMPNFRS